MKAALSQLIQEHRLIDSVLKALQGAADDCQQTQSLDLHHAEDIVAFLDHFAEKNHCRKEEAYFVPLLQRRGVDLKKQPCHEALEAHELESLHVANLQAALREYREACDRFVHHARQFVALLTDHMARESRDLFPHALKALENSDWERLAVAFDRFEEELGREGVRKWVRLGERLAQANDPSRAVGHGSP